MRATLVRALLAGLLTAGIALPVQAANPRVTLKLEGVTCQQALDELAKVSGVTIDLQGVPRPLNPSGRISGPQAKLNERASFQWTQAPFGQVVRDLCSRYHLRFEQFGGRYTVFPGAPAAPKVGGSKPRFLLELEGFRLYAVSVATNSQRGLLLDTGENRSSGESLSLSFKVEWPGGEPDALIGFESVAARDDQGNVLLWRPPFAGIPMHQNGAIYPDEWQGTIQLLDAQPRARKLAWLEGELRVYGVYHPQTLEFPVAGATLPVQGKLLGTSVEVARIDLPKTDAGSIVQRGPRVITRLRASASEDGTFSAQSQQLSLTLVGASGTLYPGRGGNISARTGEGVALQEMETEFPPVPEPISKIVYRAIERREPRRLVSFRFENIPIPPADILPPVVAVPVPLGFKKPAHGPFFVEDGVNLQLRTELNGRAAPDGMLSVGLARREAEGWSSIRWQETEVELGGVSRLRGLQPGSYRLLRNYRPRVAVDPGGNGHWEGGELEIEVTAGKEVSLAPLRWVSDRPLAPARPRTAPKPGPAPKPLPRTRDVPRTRNR